MEGKNIANEEEVRNASNEEVQNEELSQEETTEEVVEELSELETLQLQNSQLNDKYLRLYSDFDNFRKRTQKEKFEIMQNGGSDVLKTMLSVVDDFERAIDNNEKVDDVDSLKEGFTLIHSKLMGTLEAKGLKKMEAKGQPFDADLHEAITNIPAPEEKDKGTCFDVIEQGYFLNDKVLRYAKVVVAQ